MATITARLVDQPSFTALLTRIGLNQRSRDQIIADDFDTADTLVQHYSNDISGFDSYLKNLNKIFSAARANIQF